MSYTEVMRVVSSSGSPTRWQRVRQAMSRRSHWLGPYNLATITAGLFGETAAASTGVRVSEETALTYSAFWACVNAISTDVASLPLIHYKRASGGGKERYTDSKLYRLLHDEPNPEMTSFTMRQVLTAHALTWGGGFAEIERGGDDKAIALWPITPDRVTPGRDTAGSIQYRITNTNSPATFIPAADMLHIPGLGFNGLTGYSVVGLARESIGLGLATERFGGEFFGNGMAFGGVIKYKTPKPPELAEKNSREVLERTHQGPGRAHKILHLYNGAEYDKGGGIPPNDAQFLETRLHQVEEMCRWFRIPPHKIQHLLRSTNNNIEHQGIEYYTDTLRPWLVRWEQEINRKLISPSERRIQFAEHLIDGVLRGDLPSRYAAYAIGRQWGWLSADDICDRENMNPLPNGIGKVYLLPMNMTPADRITELIDAQIKAKTTPPPAPGTPPAEPDPTVVQQNALALVDNIRTALTEAQQRAETLVARAVQAETQAAATGELQAEAEQLRAAAATAQLEVGTLQVLLLEATTRADQAGVALLAAQADLEARTLTHASAVAAAAQRDVEANADVLRLTGEVAAAQQALTEAEARATTERDAAVEDRTAWRVAVDETAAAVLERDSVRAELVPAREAQAAAEAARLEAEARAVLEAAARTEAEAAGAAEHAANLQRMTAVIASHRGLIVDAMGRMIRRETEKARRAQTTPEKLRLWIDTFYPVHADICRAALLPAMRTHLAWQLSADDPMVVTTALVTSHIHESIRQLRLVLESDPEDVAATLETTLRYWELDRADALADVILKEAIDHVRHAD